MTLLDVFGSLGAGFIGSGLFAILFKEYIKKQFRKEVELELATFNHELQIKSEVLKNDLQKDVIKTQLMWNNIHKIYPVLTENLELAYGVLGDIVGLRWEVNLSELDEENLKSFMMRNGFDISNLNRCINLWEQNKENGIKEIKKLMKINEVIKAQNALVKANNFKITKEIYLSDGVSTAFLEAYQDLYGVWIDINASSDDSKSILNAASKIHNTIPMKMIALRNAVKSELRIDKI